MKINSLIGVLSTFCVVSICSCGSNGSNVSAERAQYVKDSIARAQFVKDSIAKEEFRRDSIAKATENAKIINKCKSLYIVDKDEFSKYQWIKPKSAPKYRNSNGVYCYFALENDKPKLLRFVFQYYADSWLFIDNMVFNIDDELITIKPTMKTDCGEGGNIWEWCDEYVGGDVVNEDFIKKIANAKSVKVKLNGTNYYDTKTLTPNQIKSIKDTYDYYTALGGKIIKKQ